METRVILIFAFFACVATEDVCFSSDASCQQCIQKRQCAWRLNEPVEASESRCIPSNAYNGKEIYNPGSTIKIVKSEPLGDTYKVSPQEIQLKLRVGKPVYFNVTFDRTDTIAPPRFANLIVEQTRDQPDRGLLRIEAVQCPKDPTKSKETLHLVSYQSRQQITLETEILCTCPTD